ncbi:MAG: glycoside hydrolase family 3 C-terminal domain-containing protein, partial [Dehalococcoidia bacterium]
MSPKPDPADLDALCDQLTRAERAALTAGADAWHTVPVPRLGILSVKVSDGPNGVRGDGVSGTTSACFPIGAALGATWDRDLVRRVGEAMAQEAKTKGVHVILAPTINIQRHPLAGRNFECYSEDPFLTAEIAGAFIAGVQGEGVGATAKHFVCNDSEYERHTISSRVDDRALHELYLFPFEAAVVETGVWAVMTAYNRINGTYACDNEELVRNLLKGSWEFDGLVMSDWWGTMSTVAAARAGLDLEMPGPARHFGARLEAAVEAGEVDERLLREKAERLLRLAARTGAFDRSGEPEESIDSPVHRALIRETAAEAMVLLTNDGTLPLDPGSLRSVAVIGPNAENITLLGGGSSGVQPHHVVQPLDALRDRLEPGVSVTYERGVRIDRTTPPIRAGAGNSIRCEFFGNSDLDGSPVLSQTLRSFEHRWISSTMPEEITGAYSLRASARFVAEHEGDHRFTLVSTGPARLLLDGELLVDNWTNWTPGRSFYGRGSDEVGAIANLEAGGDHEVVVEFRSGAGLPVSGLVAGCREPEPADLFERAVQAAGECDAALLVVGLNAGWETEGEDRLSLSLPGRQDELVERVAAVNPRTVVVVNAGSPVAMPWAEQVAAVLHCWYPGQEAGDALADVLLGARDPGGRLACTFPVRVEDSPAHLT